MGYRALIFGLALLFGPFSSGQAILIESDSTVYSHAASLELIKKNTILPNGDTLANDRLIAVAFGGSEEGKKDNIIWSRISNDHGQTWIDYRIVTDEAFYDGGDTLARDPLLYLLPNKELLLLFRVQNSEGSGSGSGPTFAYYKKSSDAGLSWSASTILTSTNHPLDSTYRNYTSISAPVRFNDSLYFPFYYRDLGVSKPHFAVLVSDTNFTSNVIRNYHNFTADPILNLIEPSITVHNGVMSVFFRNRSGLTYVTDSQDGLNWTPPRSIKIPNTYAKSEFYRDAAGVETYCLNAMANNRDNLVAVKRDGGLTGYYPIAELLRADESQVSYPSFRVDSNTLYVTFSRVSGRAPNRISRIFFREIDLGNPEGHVNNLLNSRLVTKLNTPSAIVSYTRDSAHTYILNKHGRVFKIAQDSLITDTIDVQTLLNRAWDIGVAGNTLYVTGNLAYTYGKFNLSTGLLDQTFTLTLTGRRLQMAEDIMIIESIDRDRFFVIHTPTDSLHNTIQMPTGLIHDWTFADSVLYVTTWDSLFYRYDLNNPQFQTLEQLNGIGKVVYASHDTLVYHVNDSLLQYDLTQLSSNYITSYPMSSNPSRFESFPLDSSQLMIADGMNFFSLDLGSASASRVLDSTGVHEFHAIVDLGDKLLSISSFGNLYLSDKVDDLSLPDVVEDNDANQRLLIYPNPVRADLKIISSMIPTEVSVHDMTGRIQALSFARSGDGLWTVDTRFLVKGIYQLMVTYSDGKIDSKIFVKQ